MPFFIFSVSVFNFSCFFFFFFLFPQLQLKTSGCTGHARKHPYKKVFLPLLRGTREVLILTVLKEGVFRILFFLGRSDLFVKNKFKKDRLFKYLTMSGRWWFKRQERRAKTPPPFIQCNVTMLRTLIIGNPARSPSVPAKIRRTVNIFDPEESVLAKRKSSKGRTKEDIFNSIASMLSSVSDCIDDLLSNISEIISKESEHKSDSGKEGLPMGTIISKQDCKFIVKCEEEKERKPKCATHITVFNIQVGLNDIGDVNKNCGASDMDSYNYKVVNGVLCLKMKKKVKVKKHVRVRKLRDY